jgi:hypothetical protein
MQLLVKVRRQKEERVFLVSPQAPNAVRPSTITPSPVTSRLSGAPIVRIFSPNQQSVKSIQPLKHLELHAAQSQYEVPIETLQENFGFVSIAIGGVLMGVGESTGNLSSSAVAFCCLWHRMSRAAEAVCSDEALICR